MLSLGRARRAWRKARVRWQAWTAMARRLWPYVARRRSRLALSLVLGLLFTAIGLAEPWTMKLILDNVLLQQPIPRFLGPVLSPFSADRIALLNAMVVALVLLAGLRGLVYYYQKLLAARVGQQVAADLRLDFYRHLQFLSFRFHDRRRTGDLIARLIGDIRYLRDIFVGMPLAMAQEGSLIVGMLIVMFAMDWSLTLLALAALPGVGVILRLYQKPMRAAVRQQREREGDIASMATDALGAIKVVQGFRREKYEIDRFGIENKRSMRTGLKAARLEAKLRWMAEVTVAAVSALVIGVAARRVIAGSLSPGDLLVFVTYLRAFNRPLRRVSNLAERSARGTVAGERIFRLLDTEPTVRDLPGAARVNRFRGEIRFENVWMRYGTDDFALRGIDLHIAPGERVAVVGPTGSGKTSLASLIPRFYDPSQGCVRLDGHDLREVTLASVRDAVALVFQEPVLFAATVAENIRVGKADASLEEVIAIAKRTGIHPIVSGLPEGYDTVLGERGGTLSGGQRQAIAIARALIKNAPVVILDEPTTGLDPDSSGLVVDALDRLMEGRTVLLITHQMETLRGMDRIVVLTGGRISEEGPHEQVLERSALYRSFHDSRVKGTVP